MYKVFINDTPIIITSSLKNEKKFRVYQFKEIGFEEIIQISQDKNTLGLILYSTDLEKDWISFTLNMEVIPAAGGLVINEKNQALFILRNSVWDLPKGWIEKGESVENAAIREVEEECGIYNLSIVKKLLTTYHIYFHNGAKLKETHWFLMHSDYNQQLKPQFEEGITRVNFINESEIKNILQNSYANIQLVYQTYNEN